MTDNYTEIHNLNWNNTHILSETQAVGINAILKTRVKEKEPIHMLDTEVDGEPLLCVNGSQWAYGTKIHFLKQEGKRGGDKKSLIWQIRKD